MYLFVDGHHFLSVHILLHCPQGGGRAHKAQDFVSCGSGN